MGARIEMFAPFVCLYLDYVAPLVGARIEMIPRLAFTRKRKVAPLVGARIEIADQICAMIVYMSLPSWERGLKCPTIK